MIVTRTAAAASVCSLALTMPGVPGCSSSKPGDQFPTTRSVYDWPFARDSIWNMPIGANAVYVDAELRPSGYLGVDDERIVRVTASDPLVDVYVSNDWNVRCTGTSNAQWDWNGGLRLQLPAALVVPDASPPRTPNNVTTVVQADGRSLVSLAPFARCVPGGPAYGYTAHNGQEPLDDIFGDGERGAHGGSGLSGLGGTIRLGELIGDEPIRHALKLNVWAARYLSYAADDDSPGYRWPATRADAYAADVYGGTRSGMEMGALLALPPTIGIPSLHLQTIAGSRIAIALQDYGAYVVDDTAWDSFDLNAEVGVQEEFEATFGLSMTGRSGPFYDDMMMILGALHVVDNNAPASIGGGGARRQPLAPSFED